MWDEALFVLPLFYRCDEDDFKLKTELYIACICENKTDVYDCIAIDMKKDSISTIA